MCSHEQCVVGRNSLEVSLVNGPDADDLNLRAVNTDAVRTGRIILSARQREEGLDCVRWRGLVDDGVDVGRRSMCLTEAGVYGNTSNDGVSPKSCLPESSDRS
jgi:hypothetical protein